MGKWPTVTIGHLGQVFDGPHATPRTVDEGPIFLGISALQDGRINLGETRHVTPEDFVKWTRRVRPQAGDVVFSYETRLGQAAIVPEGMECCLGRRMGLVRLDQSKVVSRFFLYYYISPSFQEFLRTRTVHGATVDRILLTEFPSFLFPCPPVLEQQRIASLLGALDDKIELNRQTNETLEALARAIFKDWFVDFGPTRAKAEGQEPYLVPELWGLFPDALDDEDKPVGWVVGSPLDLADLISGGTPKTSEPKYWDGEIAWASAKDVSTCGQTFLLDTERKITDSGLRNSSTRIVPALSTVVVARGATTGRLCMFGVDIAMNQTCYALRAKDDFHYFLNCWFDDLVGTLVHSGHGSVFNTITTKTFQSARTLIPSQELREAFNRSVAALFELIRANLFESTTLAQTRDLLLPKLMSGEIRLKDAERIVGEVT